MLCVIGYVTFMTGTIQSSLWMIISATLNGEEEISEVASHRTYRNFLKDGIASGVSPHNHNIKIHFRTYGTDLHNKSMHRLVL